MRVTILIGNGFDLALGLRTRYMDFLEHYRVSDKDIASVHKMKEIIDDDRKKALKRWSCAEEAFGRQKFSQYGDDVVLVLDECETDFQSALTSYLKQEERRFKIPQGRESVIRREFRTGVLRLISLCKALTPHQKDNPSFISFIDFNYTSILDELLVDPSAPTKNAVLGRNVPKEPDAVRFGMPCHVHGSLRMDNILFGVDDSSQILDDKLKDAAESVGYLIKPEMDRGTGVRQGEVASRLIDIADVIIVFGMSYGKTDGRWWSQIVNHLFKDKASAVVLCPYVEELPKMMSCVKRMRVLEMERNRLISAVRPQASPMVASVRDRIQVIGYGPYPDHDRRLNACDPIGLTWIKEQCLSD